MWSKISMASMKSLIHKNTRFPLFSNVVRNSIPFPVQNGCSSAQNGNSSVQNWNSSVQNGNSSVQNGKIIISINIKNIL